MATVHPVQEYYTVPPVESPNGVPSGEWRPVVTPHVMKGIYEVSDTGLVANLRTHKILKIRTTPNSPIRIVSLKGTSDSGVTSARIDRLILEAFVGPAPEGQVPLYLDGDKTNCTLDNLNWGSPPEGKMIRSYHSAKKTAAKKKRPGPKSHDEETEVTMDRRYRFRGVSLEVHQNGSVTLIIPGGRPVNMSAITFTSLARVVGKADEMNKLLSVGRATVRPEQKRNL
jgi:hypothetical protein